MADKILRQNLLKLKEITMRPKIAFAVIVISVLCFISCSTTDSMLMYSRMPVANVIADSEQYNTYYFGSSMALTSAILFVPKNSALTVKIHPYWDKVPGGEIVLKQMVTFMNGVNFTLRPVLYSIDDKDGKFLGWLYNFPMQMLLVNRIDETTVSIGTIYPTVYDMEGGDNMF